MTNVRLRVLVVAGMLVGCDSPVTIPEPPVGSLDAQLRGSLGGWGVVPIGAMPPQPPAQVALGRMLFFDKVLSGNRDVACGSCHDVSAALADGRSLAVGTGGTGVGPARTLGIGRQFTPRSAPTLLNGGLGLGSLFWDGRLAGLGGVVSGDTSVVFPPGLPNTLVAQAMMPVLDRREMRGERGDRDADGRPNELALFGDKAHADIWDAVMRRLLAIQEYVAMFTAAFPAVPEPRFEHAARAIAVFQMEGFNRTRSPFDRYLDRDDQALTTEQKRGGLLFFGKARCSSCHNGPFLGGQGLANVGAPQVGPGRSPGSPLDRGRGEFEADPFYRFAFRVAPLRNVELTAPYFHSGVYPTLEAVVKHYNNVPVALANYDPSQLAPDVRPLYRGDAATTTAVLATLDGRLRQPLGLTDAETAQLVAFLKSLTDPAARDLRSVAPVRVPSGLPIP
ncbi:MAG: cytochrome-c peroxidase [Gemmatimonadales bacterium]